MSSRLLPFAWLLLPLSACAAAEPLSVTAPGNSREPMANTPMVIAHRGASAQAPENTLAAIEAALDIGSPAIEIDLRRSSDGVAVVIHDADLERTTDGEGEVSATRWDDIRRLDAGSWFAPEFAGTRVPRLEQVLQLLASHPADSRLILELKDGGEGFEETVVAAIRGSELPPERIILKAFERDILARLAQLAPAYERLYVFNTWIGWLNLVIDEQPRFVDVLEVPEQWLQVHSLFLDEEFLRRAQAGGYRVIAWNVHEEDVMRRVIEWQVDGIETDYPAKVMQMIAARRSNGAPVDEEEGR